MKLKQTHMQIRVLGVYRHVIEFYWRFLPIFLGFVVMDCASRFDFSTQWCDFGGGFVVLGCFSQICNVLGVVCVFGLGLKVLQSKGLMQFLGELRNGFCMRSFAKGLCDSNVVACSGCDDSVKFTEKKPNSVESNQLFLNACDLRASAMQGEFSERISPKGGFGSNPGEKGEKGLWPLVTGWTNRLYSPGLIASRVGDVVKAKGFSEECNASEEVESCDEDNELDVLALRRLVKMQRHIANAALVELEKERVAAASAADEAMAMILRLQSEKSLVEIEANQYRRLAEQKQRYDQEVIQSLRWIIMKHESEGIFLNDTPGSCRKQLKQCREGQCNHEIDMDLTEEDDSKTCLFDSLSEEGLDDDVLYSSLDYDTSVLASTMLAGRCWPWGFVGWELAGRVDHELTTALQRQLGAEV